MAKKKIKTRVRNWVAVHAHLRRGAGHHGDARKETNAKACRGRYRGDQE